MTMKTKSNQGIGNEPATKQTITFEQAINFMAEQLKEVKDRLSQKLYARADTRLPKTRALWHKLKDSTLLAVAGDKPLDISDTMTGIVEKQVLGRLEETDIAKKNEELLTKVEALLTIASSVHKAKVETQGYILDGYNKTFAGHIAMNREHLAATLLNAVDENHKHNLIYLNIWSMAQVASGLIYTPEYNRALANKSGSNSDSLLKIKPEQLKWEQRQEILLHGGRIAMVLPSLYNNATFNRLFELGGNSNENPNENPKEKTSSSLIGNVNDKGVNGKPGISAVNSDNSLITQDKSEENLRKPDSQLVDFNALAGIADGKRTDFAFHNLTSDQMSLGSTHTAKKPSYAVAMRGELFAEGKAYFQPKLLLQPLLHLLGMLKNQKDVYLGLNFFGGGENLNNPKNTAKNPDGSTGYLNVTLKWPQNDQFSSSLMVGDEGCRPGKTNPYNGHTHSLKADSSVLSPSRSFKYNNPVYRLMAKLAGYSLPDKYNGVIFSPSPEDLQLFYYHREMMKLLIDQANAPGGDQQKQMEAYLEKLPQLFQFYLFKARIDELEKQKSQELTEIKGVIKDHWEALLKDPSLADNLSFDKFLDNKYITNFALSNFTVDEVNLLELIGASFQQIQTLQSESGDYKSISFTEEEISEIKQKLVKIDTEAAKNLSAKFVNIKDKIKNVINENPTNFRYQQLEWMIDNTTEGGWQVPDNIKRAFELRNYAEKLMVGTRLNGIAVRSTLLKTMQEKCETLISNWEKMVQGRYGVEGENNDKVWAEFNESYQELIKARDNWKKSAEPTKESAEPTKVSLYGRFFQDKKRLGNVRPILEEHKKPEKTFAQDHASAEEQYTTPSTSKSPS